MPKIGVIAPNTIILDNALAAAKDLGMSNEVMARVGNVWDAVELAREMTARGAEVIVARGSTADFLMRSEPQMTVVPITLSCRDLRQVVMDAQRITGLAKPRIAIMSVHVMSEDVELYAQALGVDIDLYPIIGTPESIEKALDDVAARGADIVVGGCMTMHMAEADGFPTLALPTGMHAMKLFLGKAATVVHAIAMEHSRTKRFETLIRHIREGFIYVEATGRIRIVNPAAELMLGRTEQELVASRIGDVLPIPGISECLVGLTGPIEELISIGGATLIVTLIPAPVGQDPSDVIVSLQETARISQMDTHIRRVMNTRGLTAAYRFDDIWGDSKLIRETRSLAAEYAAVDSTVLIFGETGTGKELFAQSIHNASRHASGPFVAVNCAALPPSLLESELFGYEEGAFTGANRRGKAGLIELAHKGTLFLDEISEMDHYGQVRLLRFLQERQIMRLGGDKYIPIQVRVIAATNRDLGGLVTAREFREDLYYRLKVLTLNVPPLRERLGDIPHLIERMRAAWEAVLGSTIRFAPEVMPLLVRHSWPGNIRELANVMENLAVAGRSRLVSANMVEAVLMRNHCSRTVEAASQLQDITAVAGDERGAIISALSACGGNKGKAAGRLGMHRSTLHRKMLAHGIKSSFGGG